MGETPTSVTIPVWGRTPRGGLLRRDALEPEHPLSVYSYIKGLGLNPKDFGVSETIPYAEHRGWLE